MAAKLERFAADRFISNGLMNEINGRCDVGVQRRLTPEQVRIVLAVCRDTPS